MSDSAITLMGNYILDIKNPKKADIILKLFDNAISCDSNYFRAYYHKRMFLGYLKRFKDELEIVNKMLLMHKENLELIMNKGFLYEKLGQLDSAKNIYDLLEQKYDKRIKLYPENMNLEVNRLLFTSFIHGKEQAKKELEKDLVKYPKNSSLLNCKLMLDDFNREGFMNYTLSIPEMKAGMNNK